MSCSKEISRAARLRKKFFRLRVYITLFWNCMAQGDHSDLGETVGFGWRWADWFTYVFSQSKR